MDETDLHFSGQKKNDKSAFTSILATREGLLTFVFLDRAFASVLLHREWLEVTFSPRVTDYI